MAQPGVARDIVLRALRAAGPPNTPRKVFVSEQPGSWFVTVSDGVTALLEYIPPEVGLRTVNQLSRRFKVPKEWFVEPLLIPIETPPQ
jgi:hypothetical protein